MNLFKKTAVATMLATGLFATTSATAAELTTTVNLDVPQMVIIYGYDEVNLQASANALAEVLHGTGTTDSLTVATPQTNPINVTDLAGTVNVGLDTDTTFDLPGTNPRLTLENFYGLRSLGYSNYTLDNIAVSGTQFDKPQTTPPANTGLTLATGDLSFEVVLEQLTSTATGTFTISILGS